MSFIIDDEETVVLVKEFARRLGTTDEDAIRIAVVAELKRLTLKPAPVETMSSGDSAARPR